MKTFTAWASGTPRPKGSMRQMAGGRMIEDNAASAPWRRHVARVCRERRAAYALEPLAVPVSVALRFLFLRPTAARWPVPATVETGDVDKLTRNVLDALSAHDKRCGARCDKHAGVYTDDALVCDLADVKARYVASDGAPGVLIMVAPLDLDAL